MPPAKHKKESPTSAADRIPDRPTLPSVRDAARDCRACDLWKLGTQTVFGEGARRAEIMLVGEQPGDQEDISGHPFVGPAGKMLDRALDEAGIDRGTVYVTNVVKHFKWTPRGKRRIHAKPNAEEINACKPWLEQEIDVVDPAVVACLGATAAQALLGRSFRVTKARGTIRPLTIGQRSPMVTATIHPSAILRADNLDREAQYAAFVDDLRVVARPLAG